MKISTVKDIKDALMNEYEKSYSKSKCPEIVKKAMYNIIINVDCDNEYYSVGFGIDENCIGYITFHKSVLNTEWKDGWAWAFLNGMYNGILYAYFKSNGKSKQHDVMHINDVCNFSGNYIR